MTNPLVLVRDFEADAEMVFAFVTQSENLHQWWGPEGVTISNGELDFTRKGPWQSTMVNAEGGSYHVSGEVIVVDPPNSVEFTWAWHNDGVRGNESVVRFEVASRSQGGSTFTLTHTGLADEESVKNHTTGWTSSLKKLERMAG